MDSGQIVAKVLGEANTLMARKAYRAAITRFRAVIESVSVLPQPYIGLGQIYLAIKDFAACQSVCDDGLAVLATKPPLLATIGLDINLAMVSLYRLKGEAHIEAKQYQEAIELLSGAALKLAESAGLEEDRNAIEVAVGRAYYASGDQDVGISLIQNVLGRDEGHFEALYHFAIALKARGRPQMALEIYLKLLVIQQKHAGVREKITDIISSENGMELLDKAIGEAAQSPAALAFIGLLIKENSALDQSIVLYERALAGAPSSASYALNLVHGYEIVGDYNAAWNAAISFLSANPSLSVGTVSSSDVLSALGALGQGDALPTATPFFPCASAPLAVEDALALSRQRFDPDSGVWTVDVVSGGKNDAHPPASESGMLEDSELVSVIGYDVDELDLLALLCTMVKILYNVGAVPATALLIPIIDGIRGTRPIHRTTIRNEHAYYCCIAQVLAYPLATPLLEASSLPPLYVAGDSHSQTPAWRTVCLDGVDHVLTPRIVTGLKIWHLREESRFYPKANFWRVMETIPRGANVMFVFGEIDCREGFLVAVAKQLYETIEEAALVTINVYMKTLLTLVSDREWTIFIHPAVPVLNETRAVVKTFNALLKDKLTAFNHPNLRWLPFFDTLLDPSDPSALNSKYGLDGTHLNPLYVDDCLSTISSA